MKSMKKKLQGRSPTITKKTSSISAYQKSLEDPDVVERLRVLIKDAHVFKLPPRQSATIGWKGAEWQDKVWQGNVKIIERAGSTFIILVDSKTGENFAVCPVQEGSVERCVDSSRYFVLRVENADGRHLFIGMAFNERNDSFDFNIALEDSRREREMELKSPVIYDESQAKDYSLKVGEKIHVSIPKTETDFQSRKKKISPKAEQSLKSEDVPVESDGASGSLLNGFMSLMTGDDNKGKSTAIRSDSEKPPKKGGFLAPSSKDTPRRIAGSTSKPSSAKSKSNGRISSTRNKTSADPFSVSTFSSDPFLAGDQTKK
mmetsp:Transcript_61447/g.71805  ORF Transcript_61447/g.71805 Transcript_61447/m.71805 type:complete len:316 (+) Transcript_61447:102-1049(+)